MIVKLFDSLTNKLKIFKSLEPHKASIYLCGPTTYNFLHIGNLRPIIVFDVLVRLLTYLDYKVTYVTNFTDIDDKIIFQAQKNHKTEKEISDFYINEIKKDFKAINIIKPNFTPRVTNYIKKIICLIQKLLKKNFAYVSNGDVYFKVNLIKNYGQFLSNVNANKLKTNLDKNFNQKNDFVIWKKTDIGINWKSPWGNGRPGWHTECFAMINFIFPKNIIDIHCGGFDLKFPHHENEIAQQKALYHNHLANYWLHNGFVIVDQKKMSKSLNNVVLAKDIIQKYGNNVIRLMFLTTNYHSSINFSEEKIINAQNELHKIEIIYNQLAIVLQLKNIDIQKIINQIKKNNINFFVKHLANDLNVSNAITSLFSFLKIINQELNGKQNKDKLLIFLQKMNNIFFLLGLKLKFYKVSLKDRLLYLKYKKFIKNKQFDRSDKIRSILLNKFNVNVNIR